MKSVLKYLGTLVLGVGVCVLVFSFLGKDEPIKFVSMTQVFQKSDLKKEYENKLNQFEEESNAKLLKMDEEIKQKEIDGASTEQVQYLRGELNHSRELLSTEYQKRSEDYNTLVWQKINKKVEKYGKERGYKYILGATGDGSIMYADDSEDITKEVIKYINK